MSHRCLLGSGLLVLLSGLCGCTGASSGGEGVRDGAASNTGLRDASAGGSGGSGGTGGAGGAAVTIDAGTGGSPGTGQGRAAAVARKLGRSHFLIGMGNDLNNDHDKDGAYTLGVTLDVHYAYLVGLPGQGGWPDWNANGSFVNILTDSARRHGVAPMFTLYAMAARGEANHAVLTDPSYMRPYWEAAKLLFQRLAMFDGPAIVQFEPDWWGFAQQKSGGDPSKLPVQVGALAPDCAGLPDDLAGMGKCLVLLGRKHAPKVLLGFHASGWADPDAGKIARFLLAVGAGDSDLTTVDTLDRDAGCFEARVDPNCQRGDGKGFYWDEQNRSSPNFHEHLAWAKALADGVGKPILWWQTPFGVPSATPGGSAGKYRDNRVKYLFEHVDELIAAGGVGAVFGTGAGNQTTIDTDGGQFKNAVTRYFAAPVALP